jgi:hypothetical protein
MILSFFLTLGEVFLDTGSPVMGLLAAGLNLGLNILAMYAGKALFALAMIKLAGVLPHFHGHFG